MLNYKKPSFWVTFLTVIIVAVIGIGLAANSRASVSLNDANYRVKEVLYQDPLYSFIYMLNTAPQYSISSDYKLYSKEINDEDWTMQGELYSYEISKQELHTLFVLPSDDVYKEINNKKLIYRADTYDEKNTFYLVMQLKNGDVLLALGYDREENPHIRWLFKLEKISDINDDTIDKSSSDIRWDTIAELLDARG
jgi:hypothetical protein